MSLKTVEIPGFGGLVLTTQPDVTDPSQAIDLLNVTFPGRGTIRNREGYAKLTSTALTNQPDSISPYYTSAGTKRLVVGNGNRLDVLTSFPGATAANSTAPTANPHFFARFGGPTAELLFIANGTDQVRQLSGTTFSTPAGLSGQTGKFVAVWQNRLVVARESGTTAGNNPSSVNFSDPGDPTNFAAGTYEDLHPGDGEPIMGMVTWREQLIVFKQTKIFVFWGLEADAAGEANPEWRLLDTGVGLAASKAVASAKDGVYFLDRKGVYKTTGGEPVSVSDAIDPFFRGDPSIYFTASSTLHRAQIAKCAMVEFQDYIYLACPTLLSTANDRLLAYSLHFGHWELHDIPMADMCVFRPDDDEELVFAYSSTSNGKHVGRHVTALRDFDDAYTADNMATDGTGGSAINALWKSGWWNMGDPVNKKVREIKLWGTGVATARLRADYDHGTGSPVATFVSRDNAFDDAPAPYLIRQARRGTVFSLHLSGLTLNQRWAVHRAAYGLESFRAPSVTETERHAA